MRGFLKYWYPHPISSAHCFTPSNIASATCSGNPAGSSPLTRSMTAGVLSSRSSMISEQMLDFICIRDDALQILSLNVMLNKPLRKHRHQCSQEIAQFTDVSPIPGFVLFAGVFRREIRERYPLRWAIRWFRLR
jgi:hypothetical protein